VAQTVGSRKMDDSVRDDDVGGVDDMVLEIDWEKERKNGRINRKL
jgi:hypothetical protein